MLKLKILESMIKRIVKEELDFSHRPPVKIGDIITIQDFRNGKSFKGKVTKIDDYDDQWYVNYDLLNGQVHWSGDTSNYAWYDPKTGEYEDGDI